MCTPEQCEDRGPKGGLCVRCTSARWRAANLEKAREQERRRAAKGRALDPERHRAYKRARYAADPEPIRQQVREYRAANLDAVHARERAKSARQRVEHPDEQRARVRAANAAWKAANPTLWSLRNREMVRRRKLTDADPVDYAAVLDRDGMTCHICGDPIASLDVLEFDHVTPTSRGGEHTEANVRPSHRSCNRRKKDRPLSA